MESQRSKISGFTLIELLVLIAQPSLKLPPSLKLRRTCRPASKNRTGFTLIELLVVIAIIGLLSTLAIVALGSARQKSRDARRLADVKQIQTAMEMYNSETGTYPIITSTILLGDTNHACLGSNGFNAAGGCTGQYISFPKDPSGGYYSYLGTGTDYLVLAALEGSVNNLSCTIAAQPNEGITNSYNSPYGLVGWWKFDEGSGSIVYASVGNQNGAWNGTPSGSSSYYSAGKVGAWAGYFDGSTNWVGISSTNPFGNNFTVTAWVYFNAVNKALNLDNSILGSGLGGIADNGLHLTERNGRPYFGFYSDDLSGNASLAAGTWYHLAYVYDGGKKIYVNGDLDSSATSGRFQSTSTNTMIGGLPWAGSTSRQNGKIDDLKIYNRALSALEVKAIYDSQK